MIPIKEGVLRPLLLLLLLLSLFPFGAPGLVSPAGPLVRVAVAGVAAEPA